MNLKFICVDFQNDYCHENGLEFNKGSSINFIKKHLIPYIRQNKIIVNEIISDYRPPRHHNKRGTCIPGTFGYESGIPNDIKSEKQWIKCMHSPIWIRDNIGIANAVPGLPYQAPEAFSKWLLENIGEPGKVDIILFGLAMDCCVLATLQELYWRGYGKPKVLYEATDTGIIKNNDEQYKQAVASQLSIWGEVIHFEKLKKILWYDSLSTFNKFEKTSSINDNISKCSNKNKEDEVR